MDLGDGWGAIGLDFLPFGLDAGQQLARGLVVGILRDQPPGKRLLQNRLPQCPGPGQGLLDGWVGGSGAWEWVCGGDLPPPQPPGKRPPQNRLPRALGP